PKGNTTGRGDTACREPEGSVAGGTAGQVVAIRHETAAGFLLARQQVITHGIHNTTASAAAAPERFLLARQQVITHGIHSGTSIVIVKLMRAVPPHSGRATHYLISGPQTAQFDVLFCGMGDSPPDVSTAVS